MALFYAKMLLVLSWCWLSTVFGQLWCTETEECAGQDISGDMFYCWGMSACAVSNLEGSLIDCAGFMGCYASDLSMSDDVFCESEDSCALSSVTTTGGNVYCGGYYGCAGVSINCTDGIVECPGEAACRYGEIVEASEGTYCFGDYGCWYTEISGSPVVDSWGYRSSYMGYISSSGVDSMEILFGGYYAAYFASVSCESGTNCTITCDQSTSCYGLTVYCYGDCSISCDDDYDCPTVYYFNNNNDDDDTDIKIQKKWNQEKESKRLLIKNHKEQFNTFHKQVLSKTKNKYEKRAKIQQFNQQIEKEINEWGIKYNKKYSGNNNNNNHDHAYDNKYKHLDVAPTVLNKSLNKSKKNGLFVPLVCVSILFVISLIGNGYLFCTKKNKSKIENKEETALSTSHQVYSNYQSL